MFHAVVLQNDPRFLPFHRMIDSCIEHQRLYSEKKHTCKDGRNAREYVTNARYPWSEFLAFEWARSALPLFMQGSKVLCIPMSSPNLRRPAYSLPNNFKFMGCDCFSRPRITLPTPNLYIHIRISILFKGKKRKWQWRNRRATPHRWRDSVETFDLK